MYIHEHSCISPQHSFENIDLNNVFPSTDNKLLAREPNYEGIPPGILRRMGKAVRMGVGAALPILKNQTAVNGFIIGTANGGMEDCIKFLNQIIDYEEGMLTPGNFVQSTPNAIAAQMGLMTQNKSYNITHVHRGLAFENALLDVWMQLKENPSNQYIVGAVDEISSYNYNIDFLDGWYKKESISSESIYESQTSGSIAGEGATMFLINNLKEGAKAILKGIHTVHTTEINIVEQHLQNFISTYGKERVDTLITGENGDIRLLPFYEKVASNFAKSTTVIRYKHLTGEFPTSPAIALWLACTLQQWPEHCIKTKDPEEQSGGNLLIYNNYKGLQHSFILLQKL